MRKENEMSISQMKAEIEAMERWDNYLHEQLGDEYEVIYNQFCKEHLEKLLGKNIERILT